jgi:hypothetical protein
MDSLMGSNLKLCRSYFWSAYRAAIGGVARTAAAAEGRTEAGKAVPWTDDDKEPNLEDINLRSSKIEPETKVRAEAEAAVTDAIFLLLASENGGVTQC